MFHHSPPTPTKTKHITYLFSSTILGVLLSFLIHAGIEAAYLSWAATNNQTVTWYGGCSLHPAIQVILPVIGVVGGLMLGRWWWRIVYVEQRFFRSRSDTTSSPKNRATIDK